MDQSELQSDYRQIGGRNRYNHRRQLEATYRQLLIAEQWLEFGGDRGFQSKLAREFGVDPATISRDIAFLRARRFERLTSGELAERTDKVYRQLTRLERRACAKNGVEYLGGYTPLKKPRRSRRPPTPPIEPQPPDEPKRPDEQKWQPMPPAFPLPRTQFGRWVAQARERKWRQNGPKAAEYC